MAMVGLPSEVNSTAPNDSSIAIADFDSPAFSAPAMAATAALRAEGRNTRTALVGRKYAVSDLVSGR